jgi:hypothetical protein
MLILACESYAYTSLCLPLSTTRSKFGLFAVDESTNETASSSAPPSLVRKAKASAAWIANYVRQWRPP